MLDGCHTRQGDNVIYPCHAASKRLKIGPSARDCRQEFVQDSKRTAASEAREYSGLGRQARSQPRLDMPGPGSRNFGINMRVCIRCSESSLDGCGRLSLWAAVDRLFTNSGGAWQSQPPCSKHVIVVIVRNTSEYTCIGEDTSSPGCSTQLKLKERVKLDYIISRHLSLSFSVTSGLHLTRRIDSRPPDLCLASIHVPNTGGISITGKTDRSSRFPRGAGFLRTPTPAPNKQNTKGIRSTATCRVLVAEIATPMGRWQSRREELDLSGR